MATPAEIAKLRALAGVTASGGEYPDDELATYLDAAPSYDTTRPDLAAVTPDSVGADVYLAASRLWMDKAEQVEIAAVTAPTEAGVTSAATGGQSVAYARPADKAGKALMGPPQMRALARRLARRSRRGSTYSVGLLPPAETSARGAYGQAPDLELASVVFLDPRPADLNADYTVNRPAAQD